MINCCLKFVFCGPAGIIIWHPTCVKPHPVVVITTVCLVTWHGNYLCFLSQISSGWVRIWETPLRVYFKHVHNLWMHSDILHSEYPIPSMSRYRQLTLTPTTSSIQSLTQSTNFCWLQSPNLSYLYHTVCTHNIRESLSELIINDLANYRHKRVLGLAAMFGDQLVTSEFYVQWPFTGQENFDDPLPDNVDHMPLSKQLDVALTVLAFTLKTCMDEKSASGIQECLKK